MQFIFRIPSRFMTVFLDLILVSQFTMRYYLENPSLKGVGILPFVVFEFSDGNEDETTFYIDSKTSENVERVLREQVELYLENIIEELEYND